MKPVSEKTIDCFAQACRRAAGSGLVRCSSGNLSQRIDNDRFLVTSSRSWMEKMSPADISLCQISDGLLLEGGKPTVEIGFHAGILKARPEVNVVMHFQSPCATALACRKPDNINYFVIPEIPFYIGPVARIPFLLPGTKALAQAVTDAMRDHDMVVMGNHGQATVARNVDYAIQNAEFFELASEIILRSGNKTMPLSEKEINELLELRRVANFRK